MKKLFPLLLLFAFTRAFANNVSDTSFALVKNSISYMFNPVVNMPFANGFSLLNKQQLSDVEKRGMGFFRVGIGTIPSVSFGYGGGCQIFGNIGFGMLGGIESPVSLAGRVSVGARIGYFMAGTSSFLAMGNTFMYGMVFGKQTGTEFYGDAAFTLKN